MAKSARQIWRASSSSSISKRLSLGWKMCFMLTLGCGGAALNWRRKSERVVEDCDTRTSE